MRQAFPSAHSLYRRQRRGLSAPECTVMAKPTCRLTIISNSVHTYHTITGFIMLQRQGRIDLNTHFAPQEERRFPSPAMLEVTVNGATTLAYDLQDGYNFEPERVTFADYLATVDHYFKRSFDATRHNQLPHAARIHALGLSYPVIANHPVFYALEGRAPLSLAKVAAKRLTGYYKTYGVHSFEATPHPPTPDAPILFTTRAWEPYDSAGKPYPDAKVRERAYINDMRAECIRLLRKEFGARFIGGFAPSAYAAKLYPDCVLPASVTKRKNFLALTKRAAICVTTMGLHQSNGWKLGEYIAASKAIVSERLRYTVPGDFAADTNYLEFTTAADCLSQVAALAADPDRIANMQANNHRYYQQYLRPDSSVLNTLQVALEGASI